MSARDSSGSRAAGSCLGVKQADQHLGLHVPASRSVWFWDGVDRDDIQL